MKKVFLMERERTLIGGEHFTTKVAPGRRRIPPAILGRRVSFSERSVRRSTIPLPNHFRRLIPQFEFARACARNHPLALSPGTHPSNQAEMDARSSDLSTISPFLLFLVAISSLLTFLSLSPSSLTHCSLSRARPRSSLENMYRVAHSSVDKNNQV